MENLMKEYGIDIHIEELRKEYDAIFIKIGKNCHMFGRPFLWRKLRDFCNLKIWSEKEVKEIVFEKLLKEGIYNISIRVIVINYNTHVILVKLHKKCL